MQPMKNSDEKRIQGKKRLEDAFRGFAKSTDLNESFMFLNGRLGTRMRAINLVETGGVTMVHPKVNFSK